MTRLNFIITTIVAITAINMQFNKIPHNSNGSNNSSTNSSTDSSNNSCLNIFAASLNLCAHASIIKAYVEDEHAKQIKEARNREMHAKNGNKSNKKIKSHIKLAQINKGNSNFDTHKNLMVD